MLLIGQVIDMVAGELGPVRLSGCKEWLAVVISS